MRMAILKPYTSPENTQKNVKKQQPTENQTNAETEYELSGDPVFTFSLPGGQILLSGLPSITPAVGKLFARRTGFAWHDFAERPSIK